MHTAQEVYSEEVQRLSASEQLRLATMILEGLTASAASALDFSDQWSDEDINDIAIFSARYASESIGEE
jgi:hypothetical protein